MSDLLHPRLVVLSLQNFFNYPLHCVFVLVAFFQTFCNFGQISQYVVDFLTNANFHDGNPHFSTQRGVICDLHAERLYNRSLQIAEDANQGIQDETRTKGEKYRQMADKVSASEHHLFNSVIGNRATNTKLVYI